MTTTHDQSLGPEFLSLVKLIWSGKLEDARGLCIACLKVDSNRLDFLVVLHQLKVLSGDTEFEIERSLLGAFEVAKSLDFETTTQDVLVSAIRLVMELESAAYPTLARELATTLDRVMNHDSLTEFLIGVMWYVLGDSGLLTVLLENVDLTRIRRKLSSMTSERTYAPPLELTPLSRIETLDVIVREQFGAQSEMVNLLFSSERVLSNPGSSSTEVPVNIDAFRKSNVNVPVHSKLTAVLESRGHIVRRPGEAIPVGYEASEEWLSSVIEQARQISKHLRLAPESPSILVDGELLVAIVIEENDLLGWVAIRRRGVPMSVSLLDWTIRGDDRDPLLTFAAGMTIVWFLDCSLREYKIGNDHFSFGNGGIWTPRNPARNQSSPAGLESGSRVRGHVTKLPQGKTPTSEALGHAPSWIRAGMRSNETWTREHQRGSANGFDELIRRRAAISFVSEALEGTRKSRHQ